VKGVPHRQEVNLTLTSYQKEVATFKVEGRGYTEGGRLSDTSPHLQHRTEGGGNDLLKGGRGRVGSTKTWIIL